MNISAITQYYDHHTSLRIGALTLIIFGRKPFTRVEHPFVAYLLSPTNDVLARLTGDQPDFDISPIIPHIIDEHIERSA